MPVVEKHGVRIEWPDAYKGLVRTLEAKSPVLSFVSRGGATRPDRPWRDLLFPGDEALSTIEIEIAIADGSGWDGSSRFGIADALTVSLPAADDRRVVLFVERSCVLRWIGPWTDYEPRLSSGGGDARKTYSIALTRGSVTPRDRRRPALEAAESYLPGPVRVVVFLWPGELSVAPIETWSAGHRRLGLAAIDVPTANTVKVVAPQSMSGGRTLLVIHDTFSTGRALVDRLAADASRSGIASFFAAYDRVVGYEHDPLTRTLQAAAAELAAYLDDAPFPENAGIDILAHGRGGLIARFLLEDPSLPAAWPHRTSSVRDVVFISSPVAGTALAEPAALGDFLDIHTTLQGIAADRADLSTAIGPRVTPTALAEIGALVRHLAQARSDRLRLPGIETMSPSDPALLALNERVPNVVGPAYRCLAQRFEPTLQGDYIETATAMARAAERLFSNQPNDLTAPIASLNGFGCHSVRVVDRSVVRWSPFRPTPFLGTNDAIEIVSQWLGGRPARRGSSPARRPEPEPRLSSGYSGPRSEAARPISAPIRPGAPELPKEATRLDRVVPHAGDPIGQTELCAEAKMPCAPPVGEPVTLEFSLVGAGRGELEAVAVGGKLRLDTPHARLTLVVTAFDNGRVLAPGRIEDVEVPRHAWRNTWFFRVQCERPGPASFAAEVWQGPSRLFLGRLDVVAGGTGAGSAKIEAAVVDAGDRDASLVTLRVTDRRGANGDTELVFTMSGLGLNIEESTTLDGRTYETFIRHSLRQLEDTFARVPSSADRDVRLHALGVRMADDLLPPRVRDTLWQNRDAIEAIMIVATEHRLPWEVIHIDDPASDGPGFFLADKGLTRWFRDIEFPDRRRPRLLQPAFCVLPTYLSDQLETTGQEIREVGNVIGPLRRWPSRSSELLALLRRAQPLGVLHVCGHGDLASDPLRDGMLFLDDGIDPDEGAIRYDLLESQLVAANFRLPADQAPLVFLNACSAGRSSRGLIGAAGYARAFIAPRSKRGASAFVGATWAIDDAAAKSFAVTFYDRLAAGSPLHAAATAARKAARSRCGDDTTWLAYCVYGEPSTRYVGGSPR